MRLPERRVLSQRQNNSLAARQAQDPFYDRKLKSGLFVVCEHITFLVKLNVTILLFSLLGGIVLGWFPAMFAGVSLFRQYLRGDEPPFFAAMWQTYRKMFWRANCFGWITAALLAAGICDLVFSLTVANTLLCMLGSVAGAFLLFPACCFLMYGPSVCILYESSRLYKVFRLSFVIGFSKWWPTLQLGFILAASGILTLLFPQVMAFILLSGAPCLCFLYTRRCLKNQFPAG